MRCENVDIYFELTRIQRKKLNSYGHCHVMLEQIPMEIFKKITKNKQLIERFHNYKRSFIRRVA